MKGLTWTPQFVPIESIKPLNNNPRTISKEGKERLKKSLKDVSNFRAIVVDDKNVILGGNQKYSLLVDQGVKEISIMVPSRKLTSKERKRVILEDNKTRGEWDIERLTKEFEEALGAAGLDNLLPVDTEAMWQEMPEFESKDEMGVQSIVVHFSTFEDVKKFAQLVNQKITDKTKYIWIPEKKPINLKKYKCVDAT